MSTATAINLNMLGIQEMQQAIENGNATVYDVMMVVRKRIEKRIAERRSLVKNVVIYHNELAKSYEEATGDKQPLFDAPNYTPVAQPNAALPTDPEQLADTVFATVGAANVGAVISRLMTRVASAS